MTIQEHVETKRVGSNAARRRLAASAGLVAMAAMFTFWDAVTVGCSSSSSPPNFSFGDSSVVNNPDGMVGPTRDAPTMYYDVVPINPDGMVLVPVTDAGFDVYVDCPTGMGCQACCQNGHPVGVNTFINAITNCLCGSSGTGTDGKCPSCAQETCMGSAGEAGDTCDQCTTAALVDGGACHAPVEMECNADPDCMAWLACINQTNCN